MLNIEAEKPSKQIPPKHLASQTRFRETIRITHGQSTVDAARRPQEHHGQKLLLKPKKY